MSNDSDSKSPVNSSSDNTDRWATLHIQARSLNHDSSIEELVESAESLASILAERDDVGGIEVRDPLLPQGEGDEFQSPPEVPELIVYTQVEYIDQLAKESLALASQFSLTLDLSSQEHQGEDWRDGWKKFYTPMILGDGRLCIRPSWYDSSPHPAKSELVLDPGRAFGTGLHESTRLVLELMAQQEKEIGARKIRTAIDLGCGSGILGLSALKLFENALDEVIFSDIDPVACEVTRENAQINKVDGRCSYFVGGVDQLPKATAQPRWDLVFANIRPEVLIPHAKAIVALASRPQGRIFLSGILNEESERVLSHYQAEGWETEATLTLNDWTAFLMRPSP